MRGGVEHHIHPVVRTLIRTCRKLARARVGIYPVCSATPAIHQSLQRWVIHSRRRKIAPAYGKIPCRAEVGSYINSVGGNRHRTGKIHLLPPGSGLPCERGRRQQRSRVAPEVPNVCPGVVHALIEADPTNKSIAVRCKPHPQFQRFSFIRILRHRNRCVKPDRTRTGGRRVACGDCNTQIRLHGLRRTA